MEYFKTQDIAYTKSEDSNKCMCLLSSIFFHTMDFSRTILFVEPACGEARHSCYNFGLVYMHALVRASLRPDLSRP